MIVITRFDASGTKDGNVSGRLQGFCRSISMAQGTQSPMPPPQRPAPTQLTLRGGKGGRPPSPPRGDAPGLQDFVDTWGFDASVTEWLAAVSPAIRDVVLHEFDGQGSEDQSMLSRLLSFSRPVWARNLGIDAESLSIVEGFPLDTQLVVLQKFDPTGTKDGNVAIRLQRFAESVALRHEQGGYQPPPPPAPPAPTPPAPPEVLAFIQRCGLDHSSVSFLMKLDPEVRQVVMADFNPGGTKDGNILGRLQGFARAVTQSRGSKRPLATAPQAYRDVRPRPW